MKTSAQNSWVMLLAIILSFIGQIMCYGASPPTVMWQRYGTSSVDGLVASVQLNDGGKMLLGSTYINREEKGLLILLDAKGQEVRRSVYGNGYFSGGTQLPNGNFLAVGTTYPGPFGAEDAWAVCVNLTNGDVVWQQHVGGTDTDAFNSACVSPDGTVVAVGLSLSAPNLSGHKTSPSFGNGDGLAVWFDLQGNILRDRSYGGDQYDQFTVCKVVNGQLVFGGYSQSGAAGNKTSGNFGGRDFWLVGVDTDGTLLPGKDKDMGGIYSDAMFDLIPTVDGGMVCVGYSYSGVSGNKTSGNYGFQDGWIVKLDANWNILWDRDLGGTYDDFLWAGAPTPDGGVVVVGGSYSDTLGTANAGWEDGLISKLDADGNTVWVELVGTTDTDEFVTVQVNADGGIFAGGWSWDSPFGGVWLVQFSPPPPTTLTLSTGGKDENGNLTVCLYGPTGLYELQASTNLIDWITVATVTVDQSGHGSLVDSQSATLPARFYRAVKLN